MLSIVIPTYNSSVSIRDTLGPLTDACEAGIVSEIIVADDHSGDNTTDAVTTHYPAVKVLVNSNRGIAAAMNTGLAAATGKYIAYLDAGCIPGRNYFKAKVDLLEKTADCDAVYGVYELFGENDKSKSALKYPLLSDGSRYAREHMINYLGGSYMPQSAIVWRRDFLLRRKGHNEELVSNYNEELFVRSILNGLRITAVNEGVLLKVSAN